MNFDNFDFTDFRVPTPLSSDLQTPSDHREPEDHRELQNFSPPTLRHDFFIHNGSSSDVEGAETSSCCSSSTYYRSRSHSIAFFGGDGSVGDSTHSLPLFAPEETLHSVHMSHVFDPAARLRYASSSPRRSSVCAYPIQPMLHSSSEPSSPVKKRMSISSSSPLDGLLESQDSRESSSSAMNPSSSEEPTHPSGLYGQEYQRRHSVSASSLEIFRCPFEGCGKVFSRRYNLDTHVRVHTGERPFICSVCGLSFARNHDLRRHERIHLPDREFSCQGCRRPFSRQDALRRHERSNSCANLADPLLTCQHVDEEDLTDTVQY